MNMFHVKAAWLARSLPLSHSQKAQIDNQEVIHRCSRLDHPNIPREIKRMYGDVFKSSYEIQPYKRMINPYKTSLKKYQLIKTDYIPQLLRQVLLLIS